MRTNDLSDIEFLFGVIGQRGAALSRDRACDNGCSPYFFAVLLLFFFNMYIFPCNFDPALLELHNNDRFEGMVRRQSSVLRRGKFAIRFGVQ